MSPLHKQIDKCFSHIGSKGEIAHYEKVNLLPQCCQLFSINVLSFIETPYFWLNLIISSKSSAADLMYVGKGWTVFHDMCLKNASTRLRSVPCPRALNHDSHEWASNLGHLVPNHHKETIQPWRIPSNVQVQYTVNPLSNIQLICCRLLWKHLVKKCGKSLKMIV